VDTIRIDLGTEFRYDFPVHRYAPSGNPLLGFSPRSQSGSGNDFL
jgi:hypothetical protein